MGATDLLGILTPLSWAELDGHWVVFQRANGLVCELDELSGLVLSVLEQAATSREELAAEVVQAASAGGTAVAPGLVVSAIDALVAAGLVEPLFSVPQPCV